MLFPTPAKRIAILLSIGGSLFLFGCFLFCVVVSYKWTLTHGFFDIPDDKYISEYIQEFSEPKFEIALCQTRSCEWPMVRRLPSRYKAEVKKLRDRVLSIDEDGICPKVDKAFEDRHQEFEANKKTDRVEGFFLGHRVSKSSPAFPVSARESLLGSVNALSRTPGYSRLEQVNSLVTCYEECNCPADNLLLWETPDDRFGFFALRETRYFRQAWWQAFSRDARRLNSRVHVVDIFLASLFLFAFAFGIFDPALRLAGRILKWVRNGS